MRHKFNISVMILFMVLLLPQVLVYAEMSSKDKVKVAFLYKFITFVDWPANKESPNSDTLTIGIIGDNEFEPLKKKTIKGKKVVMKRFKGLQELKKTGDVDKMPAHPDIKAMQACYVIYIATSEKDHLKQTIKLMKDSPVLLVGDTDGFLEAGGMINFLIEDSFVRFEINYTAVKKAGLKMRSKLLRLAQRVI